jgi:hypothetical protein
MEMTFILFFILVAASFFLGFSASRIIEIDRHIRVLDEIGEQLDALRGQDFDEKQMAKIEGAMWAIKQL